MLPSQFPFHKGN